MDLRELPDRPHQRHPWETTRARFFIEVLRHHGLLERPVKVLDVGAGDAYFARALLEASPAGSSIVCLDPNYTDANLRAAADDDPGRLQLTRQRPATQFDLIVALDVLEHVADDARLLRELADEALAADGGVLVSVPAWMPLYIDHDAKLGHHRRYHPAELVRVIEQAGLHLNTRGGVFHSLILPRALEKISELFRGVRSAPNGGQAHPACETGLGRWSCGRLITSAVELALSADNAVSHLAARIGVGLPGLSAWALALKSEPTPASARPPRHMSAPAV